MSTVVAHVARALVARKGGHGTSVSCPSDPYANPRNDPCNPAGYIASNTLTAVAFALYIIVATGLSYNMWKNSARWMAAMVIGSWTFSAGLGLRFALHAHPDIRGFYIAEDLLVVLSPCAFIAADYVLLGRLSRSLKAGQHLIISPTRITLAFVSSDIVTFLIQAIGGSISIASNDRKTNQLGSNIFLAGLILQLVSFSCFVSMFMIFLVRVHRFEREMWYRDAGLRWFKDWRALAAALGVSCIGILIRSVYRVIELSEGYKGALTENEPLFYVLDTYPLWVAIAIYIPFWPGRFIQGPIWEKKQKEPSTAVGRNVSEKASQESGSV